MFRPVKDRINCVKRSKLLVVDSNPSIDYTRMMNGASTNTIPQQPFIRQLERWLVGLAMMVMAYLLEKAVLRSIRRSGTKVS
jgi:hypothetical protein